MAGPFSFRLPLFSENVVGGKLGNVRQIPPALRSSPAI